MASLGGKKPKPVHEREWEKLLSEQIPCTSIKSGDETIRFRSDRGKWYFHLTYNPVGHSKSKRMTVEDPDESYVLGTRQGLLASPLFKQQRSAQDLPSAAPPPPPPPPPPPTTQPDHTPTTSVRSILCRAVEVKLTYRASDIMLCCNFNLKKCKIKIRIIFPNKVSYYPLYVTTKLCM